MARIPYQKTLIFCVAVIIAIFILGLSKDLAQSKGQKVANNNTVKTARVVANGDILLHDVLYASARQPDGTYNFTPYFKEVKSWIESADLAIGDYEGTISSEYPLAGYPLFNAPNEIATTMKETGYDVVDLAHNHILDSQLAGAINTVETFNRLGLDTIGVYLKDRNKEDILIKHVNGIKIAILGYSYGYNGMEANVSKSDYEKHMSDLDTKKIKQDIKKAEKEADITIVMPQMGIEYQKKPTTEQVMLYHSMIKWGADIIFGGHPHVVEPSEVIKKDGQKKFIIYSMGNFISNQRLETVDDIWTERGLLMDVTIEKKGQKTVIKKVKAHPTLVEAKPNGRYVEEGFPAYDYRTLVLEDYIEGGKKRSTIDQTMKDKVDKAYKEMNELVNLKW